MSLKEALLDLLFPPRCPICGRSSDGEKDAPCPPCRQADFWISGPQAVVPGRAFVRCVCAGWYRGALKESMTRFKFQGCHRYALAYGPMLAEAIRTYLPGSYDCITWTPVSAARRRERGGMAPAGAGEEHDRRGGHCSGERAGRIRALAGAGDAGDGSLFTEPRARRAAL